MGIRKPCRLSVVCLEGDRMDIDELEKRIIQITLLSRDDRNKSIHWLAKQNSLIVYEVFKLKKNHFHRLKADGAISDLILIELIAFLFAVKEVIESTEILNRKNRSKDLASLRKVARNQAKQCRKARKTPKRDKLLFMQNNIIAWIEEGLSDRKIAELISTRKHIDVSHTEISRFHRELRENGHVDQ